MNRAFLLAPILPILPLVVLAACPSDPANPATLWLSSDQVETKLKLIDHEPKPF
ncbi:MAG: hypothetical protein JWO36_4868 [Myxococcales bacterium]|nr:hypothetical protein [Myxococcales bacterium]